MGRSTYSHFTVRKCRHRDFRQCAKVIQLIIFLLNTYISVSRFIVKFSGANEKSKILFCFRIYFCLGQHLNFIFPGEYDNSLQVDNNQECTYEFWESNSSSL